jgi:4-amino-4-deoxy-L-arabinose transferase-like glycosyltransferase
MEQRASRSERAPRPEQLPEFALLPVLAIAVALTTLLVAYAGRYGYLRDELYFLACGRHLAWGYPDQPPFVPLVARAMSGLAPGSLVALRLPAALAAGALVLLAGLLTRELGGGRAAQSLACAAAALAPLVTGSDHVLATTSFYLPVCALLCWLLARILRTGSQRLWLAAGLAGGAGLLDTDLVVFLIFAVVVGLAAAGPRQQLRSGWFYAGGVVALAMWSPYLAWQASHGWPELAVAHSIAAGRSGTSAPRWAILPEQLFLLPVYFAPVWITGLVRLLRGPALRWFRAVGVAYLVLAAVYIVTGGKPYYLAVMLPVLLAAGAQPTVDWITRAHAVARRSLLTAGLLLSAAALPATLPIVPLPTLHGTPVVKLNSVVGETIGWPAFVREIGGVYRSLPATRRPSAVVLTTDYGIAGAVERFGPADGLPAVYSRQNAFWYWGPPPASANTVIAVGFARSQLGFCGSLRLAAQLDNHAGVEDEEQGQPVWVCSQLRASLPAVWPSLRYLG